MNTSWGKVYQGFINKISAEIAENSQSCLLCVSIDNLPMLISSGFQKKDHNALLDLMHYLQASLPQTILIEQVDKDKLYILVKNKVDEDSEKIIQKVYDSVISYGSQIPTYPTQFSCTIGAVKISENETSEDLLNKAFVALNEARSSHYHFVLYKNDKQHIVESRNQMILANYLQDALQNKKLRLAYQPITDRKTGKVHHYECLLRIVGPGHSVTSAGPFIPIAEQLGFMDMVDAFVLKMAVDELQNNQDIKLAINLSNSSIHSKYWQEMSVQLLSNPSIASRLIVEITETSEQQDLKSAAKFIQRIKALGCEIALDDFGSGYTSFSQLQALPVDTIKIDGIFVRNIVENKESRFFVKTLKEFGDNFGLKTVAEFVESKEIADILCEIGVDYLQGNYLSPAVDYRPWL